MMLTPSSVAGKVVFALVAVVVLTGVMIPLILQYGTVHEVTDGEMDIGDTVTLHYDTNLNATISLSGTCAQFATDDGDGTITIVFTSNGVYTLVITAASVAPVQESTWSATYTVGEIVYEQFAFTPLILILPTLAIIAVVLAILRMFGTIGGGGGGNGIDLDGINIGGGFGRR